MIKVSFLTSKGVTVILPTSICVLKKDALLHYVSLFESLNVQMGNLRIPNALELVFLTATKYLDPPNFGPPLKIRGKKMRPPKTLPNFRNLVSCRKKSG